MALELYYVVGDASPQERFRLIDTSTGQAQNLTGISVAIKLRRMGSRDYFATVPAYVTEAFTGRVTVAWPAGVLAVAGKLVGDVVLTGTDFLQTIRDVLLIYVRDAGNGDPLPPLIPGSEISLDGLPVSFDFIILELA